MAMVFAESSLEAPERVAYTGRFATDPRSSLRPARVLKQSGASQDSRESSDAGRNRFGDYFDIAADPVNDTIWIVGEYVRTSREWGMTVGHVEWSAG
jgi:hypothetical protein